MKCCDDDLDVVETWLAGLCGTDPMDNEDPMDDDLDDDAYLYQNIIVASSS
jgi:hypothetical protein